jgi:hypothetical protein
MDVKEMVSIDPYLISMLVFILVSVNTCVDLNTRLIELGSTTNNISKTRLMWYYFSATYSYIIKTIVGIFVIFALITVITVLIVFMFYLFKTASAAKKGGGSADIMKNIKGSIIDAIMFYIKGNVNFMYMFATDPRAILSFFIIFPLFMFLFMNAFSMTVYKPTNVDNEEEAMQKNAIMITTHHYLYYLFVVFLMGFIIYVIYEHMMAGI